MDKITMADLDHRVALLNMVTGERFGFSTDYSYGAVRVVRDEGSRGVTVRSSKREIWDIVGGMIEVAELMAREERK